MPGAPSGMRRGMRSDGDGGPLDRVARRARRSRSRALVSSWTNPTSQPPSSCRRGPDPRRRRAAPGGGRRRSHDSGVCRRPGRACARRRNRRSRGSGAPRPAADGCCREGVRRRVEHVASGRLPPDGAASIARGTVRWRTRRRSRRASCSDRDVGARRCRRRTSWPRRRAPVRSVRPTNPSARSTTSSRVSSSCRILLGALSIDRIGPRQTTGRHADVQLRRIAREGEEVQLARDRVDRGIGGEAPARAREIDAPNGVETGTELVRELLRRRRQGSSLRTR